MMKVTENINEYLLLNIWETFIFIKSTVSEYVKLVRYNISLRRHRHICNCKNKRFMSNKQLNYVTYIRVLIALYTPALNDSIRISNWHLSVRFQVITSAKINGTVFWDSEPCSLVDVCRRFKDANYLQHQKSSP
jgi:hypothetical protein